MANLFSVSHLLLFTAVLLITRFVRDNPMLWGRHIDKQHFPSERDFFIFQKHPILDFYLEQHKDELKDDYEPYRNHCLRVLTFAVYYMGGPQNVVEDQLNLMAMALAYHDLALWSSSQLDYLDPSAGIMEKEVKEQNKLREQANHEEGDLSPDFIPDFSDADIETAREIILQHHKFTHWSAPDDSKINEALVNAVRKGDWADFTLGIVRDGLPASYLEAAYTTVPMEGFHKILAGMGKRLSPDSFKRRFAVLNIFKW